MDDPFLNHVKQGLEKDWQEWNENLNEQQRQRQEELDRLTFQPQKGARQMTDRNRYDEEPFGFDQYDLEEHIEKKHKQARMDQFLDQGAIQQRIRAIEHKGIQKECERLGISIEEGYALLNDPELYSVFESLREDTSAGALRLAARRRGIEPKSKKQPQTREESARETAQEFRDIDRATQKIGTDDWLDDHLKRVMPDDDKLYHYGVMEAPNPRLRRGRRKR